MQKLLLPVFCLGLYITAAAQTKQCAFEKLFTVRPGMDKLAVIDSLVGPLKATLLSNTSEKLPPYAKTGGDSIIKEIFVYRVDSSACFLGDDKKFQLEFADNKLYKVYITTEYSKNGLQAMTSNYNLLRSVIKPKWKYETGTRISGGGMLGFGFDYTKTKTITNKTEKVNLQYVDSNTDDPAKGFYTLEVMWVNLANTRMEGSNY